MDDDGMIGGMKKVGGNRRTPKKPTHTMFVHHKAHMARAGFEPTNLNARGERITIKNKNIEKVNKFKYLGAYVTSKNGVTEEIKCPFALGTHVSIQSRNS